MSTTFGSLSSLTLSSWVSVCGDRMNIFVFPYAVSSKSLMFRMMSSHALRAEPVYEGQVSEHVTLYLERGGGWFSHSSSWKKGTVLSSVKWKYYLTSERIFRRVVCWQSPPSSPERSPLVRGSWLDGDISCHQSLERTWCRWAWCSGRSTGPLSWDCPPTLS